MHKFPRKTDKRKRIKFRSEKVLSGELNVFLIEDGICLCWKSLLKKDKNNMNVKNTAVYQCVLLWVFFVLHLDTEMISFFMYTTVYTFCIYHWKNKLKKLIFL